VPTTNAPYISAGSQVSIGGQTLSNIVAITAGRGFSMALKSDGTVIAWGRMVNDLYHATVPAGLSNVVAIAEGENFCLAITTNRAVSEKFRQK
jgi:alpha-tubulin suppressor-like RCC1 family protein